MNNYKCPWDKVELEQVSGKKVKVKKHSERLIVVSFIVGAEKNGPGINALQKIASSILLSFLGVGYFTLCLSSEVGVRYISGIPN